ncbi:MAG: transglutaminase domain-containing protein [Eubacterium sp.]|nr:transglutaminase domain-containing protein [Eubacterium sp.]
MKKKEKKVKAEAVKPTILIGNTGKKDENPLLILAVKLIFTYLFTFGILMNFTTIYRIPYGVSTAVEQTLLFVTVFFTLLTLIRKRYVIPAIVLIVGNLFLLGRDRVGEALCVLRDHLLIQLDSRLMSTLQYVPSDSYAFLTQTQDYIAGKNLAMLIVAGFIALIVTLCCYKKFSVPVLLAFISALYAPAFVAEHADYTPYLLVILTAFVGMYSIASSNTIMAGHEKLFGKRREKISEEDRQSVIEKAYRNITQHGRNCLTGVLSAVLALAVALGVQHPFPDGTYLDVKDVINYVVELANDVGEFFSLSFGGDVNGIFSGYFASDNFFINNRIELNAPPNGGTEQILKVYTNSPKPLYLTGDIGVNFNGSSWESIQRLTARNTYISGNTEISESFSNDDIMPIFAMALRVNDYFDPEFLKDDEYAYTMAVSYNPFYDYSSYDLSKSLLDYRYSRVTYLKNTNIVFKPYMPANGNYLQNNEDKFSFYGDSVLRIADSKNWMDRYESDFIVPAGGGLMALAYSYTPDSYSLRTAMRSMGYTDREIEQYLKDKKAYDEYVKQFYMDVPANELENIRRLNSEFQDDIHFELSDYAYADKLCEYLKNNYTYSLTVDNKDGGNTMLGNFLFETRQGHCAMYASAMVLALREHGIPARYITGFSVPAGEYDRDSGAYESIVLENNLHAWVEAYFPNIGWMMFDPTGSGYNGGGGDILTPPTTTPPPVTTTTTTTVRTTPPRTTAPTTTTTAATTPGQESTPPESGPNSGGNGGNGGGTEDEQGGWIWFNPTLILMLLVLLAGALTIIGVHIFFLHLDKKEKRRFIRYGKAAPAAAVKEMYGFIMKLFSITDLAPQGSELPMEYAVRIDELMKVSGMQDNLYQIMEIIEKSEFSENLVTEEDREHILKYTEMLYRLVMDSAGRFKKFYLKLTL